MDDQRREYPMFSACGLNCGLCPRYQMTGASRCPGCAGKDFLTKHPRCGVLSCSRRKGLEYCCACGEFPCQKYDGADRSDSFITHRNQLKDLEKAKALGIDAYKKELNEKIALLETLLANYDDGRRKSFYCVAVNLLSLQDLQPIVAQITSADPGIPFQEQVATAVRLLEAAAARRNISLQLRKKSKPKP